MGVRQLTRRVMRQTAGAAIEIRQHGSAFERCCGGATIGETAADGDAGFRECARNIAAGPAKPECDVSRHRLVKAWRAILYGRLLIGKAGEFLIRNRDGRQGFPSGVPRFGGHGCDWLSCVANTIVCQDWVLRHHIHARRSPIARQFADAGQIFGREHGDDTWPCDGLNGINRQNPGVRVGRSQDRDMQGV